MNVSLELLIAGILDLRSFPNISVELLPVCNFNDGFWLDCKDLELQC
jgi:hypothetical protein